MARALWTGAISFGLVNIPVELHAAEERKGFSFSMLDKRDFSPVGFKRYSKRSGKEVPWAEIVKGYEYDKDHYVVLSDEDFRRANVKATQTIDIRAFVAADDVPPEFFETPYYLAPAGRGGPKVYALLRETLRASGRIAIAQVVIRTTNHLAAVVPNGRALMLNTLRYADELRKPTGFELPAAGLKAANVTTKEIALAKRLVDDMAQDWDAADYKDTYHRDLMARIQEKIKRRETHEITAPEPSDGDKPTAQVIDLAEMLKRSLAAADRRSPRARRAAATPRGAKASIKVAASPAARRKRA